MINSNGCLSLYLNSGEAFSQMEAGYKRKVVAQITIFLLIFPIFSFSSTSPVSVKTPSTTGAPKSSGTNIKDASSGSVEIVDITGTLGDLDWQSDWIDVENTAGQPSNPVGVSLITMNGTNPLWDGWRNGGEGEVAPYVNGTLTEAQFNLGVALHTGSNYTYAETMHTKLNNPLEVTVEPKETTGMPSPYRRNVTLTETAGLNRVLEPVDAMLTFADGDCSNATKEIRVNTAAGLEVPSQVYNMSTYGSGKVKVANVVFQANVTASSIATYCIYYGNTGAEAPTYSTDLSYTGGGTITVQNSHYKVTTATDIAWLNSLVCKDYNSATELLKSTYKVLLAPVTNIGGSWYGPWESFDRNMQVERSGPIFVDLKCVFGNWSGSGVTEGVATFRFYSRIQWFTYSSDLTLDGSNFAHLLTSNYFSLTTLPYAAYNSISQTVYLKDVTSYQDTGTEVVFNCTPSGGSTTPIVKITFSSPSVFRLQLSPNGTVPPGSGAAVYSLTDASGYVTLQTNNLTLKIRKNPWKLSVYDATGTNLISEESPNEGFENKSLSYQTYYDTVTEVNEAMFLDSSEHVFGFGERFNTMDKRGMTTVMQTRDVVGSSGDATYLPVPFFISTKGYGFYLNSSYKSTFDMGDSKSDEYSIKVPASSLDYYFIYGGGDLKQVIIDYTGLTGRSYLPSEWVFYPWMSKNSYNSQDEVTYVINKTRELDIPGNVIVIEGGGGWWGWYTPSWPDPEWMISYAHSQGVRIIIWETPVLPGLGSSSYYDYATNHGYLVKNADGSVYKIPSGYWMAGNAVLDFTNPAAVSWWLGLHDFLMAQGIDGFKTDGGEFIHDDTVVFYDGRRGAEMENLYPLLWTGTMNDYVMNKTGGNGITWSRAGFAGSQQYPCHWAGDQYCTFAQLQTVIRAGQSAGISGIPYWASDIGGYTGGKPPKNLYIRWAEFGALSPLMQYHGQEPHDPWTFDQETQDIYKFYATLRMNLMPYIYSYAKIANETGLPMMRALLLNYPDDPNTYSIEYEYTLGDELLVAPIYENTTSRSVYLPDDTWIDFWDSSEYVGSTTISSSAPLNKIPLFIKAGAIIPMNLNENYTIGGSITNFSQLVFNVYPHGTSQFSYYDAENSATRLIKCFEETNRTRIQVSAWSKNYTLRVLVDRCPAFVSQDGANLTEYTSFNGFKSCSEGWWYNGSSQRVYVRLQQTGAETEVIISPQPPMHNVAVTNIDVFANPSAYPCCVIKADQCYPTWETPYKVNITVKNEGNYIESFTVSAYLQNATGNYTIGTQQVNNLAPGATTNVTFSFPVPTLPGYPNNRRAAWPYPTYTVWANASVVPGETDTADNQLFDGLIKVKWPGDVTGDGHVSLSDLVKLAKAWYKNCRDNPSEYNYLCDFDMNGEVKLPDLVFLAKNWYQGPLD